MDNKTKDILKKLEPIRDKLLSEYYSDEEYRELVMAMGVTAWEWQQLEKGFDDFIARAESYIKHGLADEAIQELKAAQIIDPNDLEMHRCFSQAYLQLWKSKGIQKYADLAEKHAKTCLQINSEYDLAVKILAQLKKTAPKKEFRATNAPLHQKTVKTTKNVSSPLEQKKNPAVAIAIFGGIAAVFLLFYILLPGGGPNINESYEYDAPVTEETSSSETTAEETEEQKENLLTLPFEFDKKGHDNVVFDVRESNFKGKGDAYSYYSSLFNMRGYVSIEDTEVENMQLLYDLYQGNKIVHTDKGYISIPKGARPGDKFPFLLIHGEEDKVWKVNKVKLRISKMKEKAAKATYPESPEVETVWRIKQNDKINFKLKERFSEILYNPYSKDILHSFTFLIENIGTKSIEEIKCKFNWYDGSGNLISEDIVNIWTTTQPEIESGMSVLGPHKVLGLDVGQKKVTVAKYSVEILDVKF
jgi:tetratricopeptide (TPR) repeat protein